MRQNYCEPSLFLFKNFYRKVMSVYFLTFYFSTTAALSCCTGSLNRQTDHYILQVVVLDNFCKFMYHMTFIAIGSYRITIFANCVPVSHTWGSHFGKFLPMSGPFLALFVPFLTLFDAKTPFPSPVGEFFSRSKWRTFREWGGG